MIYFDNAATSWPKPAGVAEAMQYFLEQVGANPGRSAHRLSIESARIVFHARQAVAKLFNAKDPLRVVFGANVTEMLNLVLLGYLRNSDHVITSSMEHNSVMRPLRWLEKQGVEVTVIKCSQEGFIDPSDIENAVRSNTRLIVLNHASNVIGSLQPISEVGYQARSHDLLFLIDAAQTAGAFPIDMSTGYIDLLAFTGHKSLGGPMGTGGLVIGERVKIDQLQPLKRGGTGSRSEFEDQPDFLPDRYESGTLNVVGLAGLAAGVDWVLTQGVDSIRKHEIELTRRLLDGLRAIKGITVYGGREASNQTATVSFNIDGVLPSEAGLRLDDEAGILCRVGLHCAPSAHKTVGTFPTGTVRFGLGFFNTETEIDIALSELERLSLFT
jgi:cysteine desulfurase family protein